MFKYRKGNGDTFVLLDHDADEWADELYEKLTALGMDEDRAREWCEGYRNAERI